MVTPDIRDTVLVGPDPVIAAADKAWQRRDEGHVGGRARRERIGEAIAGYEKAAQQSSENAEARWKLARALFFDAKLTGRDKDDELAAVPEDVALLTEIRDLLAARGSTQV